jgi:hypothetical protein
VTYSDENKVDGIVLVTEDSQAYLNSKQEIAYREHRREQTYIHCGQTVRHDAKVREGSTFITVSV